MPFAKSFLRDLFCSKFIININRIWKTFGNIWSKYQQILIVKWIKIKYNCLILNIFGCNLLFNKPMPPKKLYNIFFMKLSFFWKWKMFIWSIILHNSPAWQNWQATRTTSNYLHCKIHQIIMSWIEK